MEGVASGFDFSNARVGESVWRSLTVDNRSYQPVSVKAVHASCSDLSILGFTRRIPPHGSGVVLLEFRPMRSGPHELELIVETEPPLTQEDRVAMHWEGGIAAAVAGSVSPDASSSQGILLSPGAAAAIKDGMHDETMFVDLREGKDYNLFHMDGSVNWTLTALKNLNSLKGKRLILIGKGITDDALVGDALELMASGFRLVQVLKGGMRAWTQMGLPVRRTGGGTLPPASVDPAELFGLRQDKWTLVMIGAPPAGDGQNIPGSISIVATTEWVSDLSRIIRAEVAFKGADMRVLVASETGERYELMERELPSDLGASVFFLNGGLRGYRQIAREYAASRDRRELKLATLQGTTSNMNGTTIRNASGCGSCPQKPALK
jgi:rhodanese-related sulfurtransferase